MMSAPALASCLITSSFCWLETPGAGRDRREEPPPEMRRMTRSSCPRSMMSDRMRLRLRAGLISLASFPPFTAERDFL